MNGLQYDCSAHLKAESLLSDVTGSKGDSALASIGNAEHDAQLQLSHEVIAPVPLEDVLPGLGHAGVMLPVIWHPPGPGKTGAYHASVKRTHRYDKPYNTIQHNSI